MHNTSLKNDEGVSPVIGVILLVAITVILAAIIGAFVFSYTGSMGRTKVVSVTMSKDYSVIEGNIAYFTFMGGQDTDSLLSFTVTELSECSPSSWTSTQGIGKGIRCINVPDETPITVVGTFTDGSSQVILKTKF